MFKTNVLVTGADGFIGSHLVEYLVSKKYNVTAFCYYNSFHNLGWLDTLSQKTKDKITIVLGDIRDSNFVNDSVFSQDIVFHLAALIGIPYSYNAPESYIDTNVKGTLNILNAARQHQTKRVLVTSTSEVYGTAKSIPIDESHPLQPQSPYSASKIAADSIALSFYYSFDLPVSIVRPFNTYGPRQSVRAIIPSIITQLLSGQKIIKLGNLKPTRDFNYCLDIARGFEAIANCSETVGKTLNIASNSEISMAELANRCIQKINPQANIIEDDQRLRPQKSEVFQLKGSFLALNQLTGWTPSVSFDDGLDKTIKFIKENQDYYERQNYHL